MVAVVGSAYQGPLALRAVTSSYIINYVSNKTLGSFPKEAELVDLVVYDVVREVVDIVSVHDVVQWLVGGGQGYAKYCVSGNG